MTFDNFPKTTTATESKSKLFSICQIRPYLFIAGYGALSVQKVKELGITHAVDATNILKAQKVENVEYIEVKVDDNEMANLTPYFEQVAKFIENAKNSNGKALVYCAAGISRSATLCMMYLVISEGVSLKEAFVEVGKARPIIAPNLGFWRQMIAYETEKKGNSSVSLLKGGMRRSIPDVYLYKSSLLNS